MNAVDKKQQLAINLVIAGVGVITAFVGVMAYLDNQKHQRVQQEIYALDTQIKALELALKQKQAEKEGIA